MIFSRPLASSGHASLHTPNVDDCRNGLSRASAQKQASSIVVVTGGVQAPCTSKSLPHFCAHRGRVEKGTMSWGVPSGTTVERMVRGRARRARVRRKERIAKLGFC